MLDILVDSREQLPLWKRGITFTTLKTGDYTTTLLKRILVIERKSPQDLYSTITKGHPRFKRELLRAKEQELIFYLAVECSEKTFLSLNWVSQTHRKKGIRIKPQTLKKTITTLVERYNIKLIWCRGRQDMRNQILQICIEAESNL